MNPALETLLLAFRQHAGAGANTLFLGAEPHPDLLTIPNITAWQPLKPLANACERRGVKPVSAFTGKFSTILFLPGKSKEEVLAGLARAHDHLAPGGTLITALANTAGASRFEKELSRATPLVFSVSKNKCRAFAVTNQQPWEPEMLQAWRELSRPRLLPSTNFLVEPGVFSADHIDPGSSLLAAQLPPSLRGTVADLGAGWGYLSHAALEKAPKISRIDLFEADARSLACARKNLPAGAPATFHWHDVTTGLAETYDHIITNPPFHSGQAKDLDLGRAFLTTAARSMKRGGTLHLVANRQLPYEPHLQTLGLRTRLIAETAGFKVLFCS